MGALQTLCPYEDTYYEEESELSRAYNQVSHLLPSLEETIGRELTSEEIINFAWYLEYSQVFVKNVEIHGNFPLHIWLAARDAGILPEESTFWNVFLAPSMTAPIPKDFEDRFREREVFLKTKGERVVLPYKKTRRNEGKKAREFSTWLRKQRRFSKQRFDHAIADEQNCGDFISESERD